MHKHTHIYVYTLHVPYGIIHHIHVHKYTDIYIYICIYTYICMYTYIHTYIHTCMHTYIDTHTYICIYIFMYTFMYLYTCRNIHILYTHLYEMIYPHRSLFCMLCQLFLCNCVHNKHACADCKHT